MISALAGRLALVLYLLSTAGYLVFVFRQRKGAAQVATWLVGGGFALQSLALIIRSVSLGQLPILNVAEALGFFGWAVVGVYLVLHLKFRLRVLGAFVAPLAVVLVLLALFLPAKPPTITPVFQSLWLTVHLSTVFIGHGFLALAFVAGVMYLLQEHQIKTKRTGLLFRRLPSLNVLDALNHYCLTWGFPMMTLGLITGAVYALTALETYWRWDPKEVWALITWLVYAALLHQRLAVGWRGRKAAVMSLVGFSILCFTFLGVSHLLPSYHSFESLDRLQLK